MFKVLLRVALVLLLAVSLVWFTFPSTAAAALSTDCELPNAFACDVSDPAGFKAIRVVADVGGEIGEIVVFSKEFPRCQRSARISWDSAFTDVKILTTPCDNNFNLAPGISNSQGSSLELHNLAPFQVAN